jgi:hypothetical protein
VSQQSRRSQATRTDLRSQTWLILLINSLQTTSRPATTVSGNYFSVNYFFLSLFAQRERVSFVADCSSTDMQIRRSRWQDLCLVVWSSCNEGNSLATNCACRVARRSQKTSRPATTGSGNSFSVNSFFLFSFLRERTRFVCCGLIVDRHADQIKQVTRVVPRGMVQLQPGYQSCNDPLLSCCASIANDKSASNNSLGSRGILFREIIFFKI